MDSFTLLPVVKNSNDVIDLRKLDDKTGITVRNLLIEDICLHLSKIFKCNTWNFDELFNFLKTDAEAKERLSTSYYCEFHFESGKDRE